VVDAKVVSKIEVVAHPLHPVAPAPPGRSARKARQVDPARGAA
jgi:hypothetical protein